MTNSLFADTHPFTAPGEALDSRNFSTPANTPLNALEARKTNMFKNSSLFTQTTRQIVLLFVLGLIGLMTSVRANAVSYETTHDFQGAISESANPVGGMVQDPATGNYYGTTRFGGLNNQGTVFCMLPGTFTVKIIHSFNGADGANPTGTLILLSSPLTPDSKTTLVGTTLNGGASKLGTIFRIATSGIPFSSLYSFKGGADGANPYAGVIQASDNSLYGTTQRGGRYSLGTVYRLNSNGTDTILHHFAGTVNAGMVDGATPNARLLQIDGKGDLVGTTVRGGIQNNGVVFRISLTGTPYHLLHQFIGTDGANPMSELIEVPDPKNGKMLYGTTPSGGIDPTGLPTNHGTVYRLYETGAFFSSVYVFGANGPDDGKNPVSALVRATNADGSFYLYGTTFGGGSANLGTVYAVKPLGTSPEIQLYAFTGLTSSIDDGAHPYSAMILSQTDSLLYGTCFNDGKYNDGTLFHITP